MPYELIGDIAAYCEQVGIEFMSTPFSVADAEAVDPHVRRHKVASYEINHVRLLQWLAATGKPLIISTGAATEDDIDFCLTTVREAGSGDITLLQCTVELSCPARKPEPDGHPLAAQRFGVPAGFSDHSSDPIVGPVAAVALGATVIEKHFTLDQRLPGPDHAFAIEPDGLRAMIQAIRVAEQHAWRRRRKASGLTRKSCGDSRFAASRPPATSRPATPSSRARTSMSSDPASGPPACTHDTSRLCVAVAPRAR